jgi:hypothetical protein
MGVAKKNVIKVSNMKFSHAKSHLQDTVSSASEVASYHRGEGGTGQSSQGSFSPGGASGADYQTTSVGSSAPDSGGPQID